MRSAWKLGAAITTVLFFVACSPVNFGKNADTSCGSNGVACVQVCSGANCFDQISETKTVGRGKVDILIVDDNSGSMSRDQSKMATKFPTFLQSLGNVDYRIAITTTDISSAVSQAYSGTNTRPPSESSPSVNQNGALQNGNLIVFGNGKKYIESSGSSSGANISYFNSAIQRQETLNCEQSGYKQCPSDDERGVFAANLAIDKNEFMRVGADLAVIVLSNEDERGMSNTGSAGRPNNSTYNNDMSLISVYKREKYDLPQTFVDKVRSSLNGKGVTVHPIIVKPGDTNCLNDESDPAKDIRAKEGFTYQELYQLIGGNSSIGSICDSDYSSVLSGIANRLQQPQFNFTCRPDGDDYSLTYKDKNGTAFTTAQAAAVHVKVDFSKLTLNVLDAPADTSATLSYKCKK